MRTHTVKAPFVSIWIAVAAALLFFSANGWAGGHQSAPKAAGAIQLDPAKRSDVTGTVLVTGANRGIGLQLAANYAKRGWKVIATARNPAEASELNALAAKNPQVTIVQLDLLDFASIDALAAKLKDVPIDVLLNNAAILGDPAKQDFWWGRAEP